MPKTQENSDPVFLKALADILEQEKHGLITHHEAVNQIILAAVEKMDFDAEKEE